MNSSISQHTCPPIIMGVFRRRGRELEKPSLEQVPIGTNNFFLKSCFR